MIMKFSLKFDQDQTWFMHWKCIPRVGGVLFKIKNLSRSIKDEIIKLRNQFKDWIKKQYDDDKMNTMKDEIKVIQSEKSLA